MTESTSALASSPALPHFLLFTGPRTAPPESLARQVEEFSAVELTFAFPAPIQSLEQWLDYCS